MRTIDVRLRLAAWAFSALLFSVEAMAAGDAPDPGLAPVDCISTSRIRRTEIPNDQTIVFHMSGGVIYINRLPRRCPGLKIAGAFSYRTVAGRLCRVDIITVQRGFGGPSAMRGPSCGLGVFQPTTKEELEWLRAEPVTPDPETVKPEVERAEPVMPDPEAAMPEVEGAESPGQGGD
jgi:hypothetical protein